MNKINTCKIKIIGGFLVEFVGGLIESNYHFTHDMDE